MPLNRLCISQRAPSGAPDPRGFTLVEMLVVISIIVLLAAMLFPALTNAIARARLTHCQNKISQITRAYLQYTYDNDGVRPFVLPLSKAAVRWTDTRISYLGAHCGLGTFIDEGYLSEFDDVWCPSTPVPGEYENEHAAWTNGTTADGSYLYLWYMLPDEPSKILPSQSIVNYMNRVCQHDYESARGWYAFVMDENTLSEYGGIKWESHPRLHKTNIGFIDGHVHGFDSRGDLQLPAKSPPGQYTDAETAKVWRKAHSLYSAP